jgi:hypothetical protein
MKIGIAGHQRSENPSAWDWVESTLSNELDALAPPLIAVCSLAIGADQLFASMVAQRGGQIHAVLPFLEYERTFGSQDVEAYRYMLSRATAVEILPAHGADEDQYLAAGQRIVVLADLTIAIWDGKPAKGKGGTANIVAYALQRGSPLLCLNPAARSIAKM